MKINSALALITGAILAAAGLSHGQTLNLLAPTESGLTWTGSEYVTWTAGTSGWSPGDTVTVELSWDGGGTYPVTVARNLPYDLGSYLFHSSLHGNGTTYRIRISWSAGGGGSVESSNDFAISNATTGIAYYINDADTGDDVYCTAAGSSSNSGLSLASPRDDLQSIIDDYVLGPGNVVFTDTGTWAPTSGYALTSSDQGSEDGWLAIAGSPNGTVVSGSSLPAGSSGLSNSGAEYLEISHFTIQTCPKRGVTCTGAKNNRLLHNTVTGSVSGPGIYLYGCHNSYILDAVLVANADHGLDLTKSNYVRVENGSFLEISQKNSSMRPGFTYLNVPEPLLPALFPGTTCTVPS